MAYTLTNLQDDIKSYTEVDSTVFTEAVLNIVTKSGIKHGSVSLFTPHTTTAVLINESEKGYINDFKKRIEELVPSDSYYEHDDWDLRT